MQSDCNTATQRPLASGPGDAAHHPPAAPAVYQQWRKRLKALDDMRHRCSQLLLSAMSRVLCFTAYGSSCIFYVAEFDGLRRVAWPPS
jgi:hypothetical protein